MNSSNCGKCPGLYYDHEKCRCTDEERFIRNDTGDDCCRYHPNAKWADGVSSECNTVLSGNGKNEFYLTVTCDNEVYRGEWLDMLLLINNLLDTYQNGKYSNVSAILREAR